MSIIFSSNLKINIRISFLPTLFRHFSNASTNDLNEGRPKAFQLEHVKKRLEASTEYLFRTRLDYTFYRRDVILDDQIFGIKRIGLDSIQTHFGIIGTLGQLFYPHIEIKLLDVSTKIEDGTVRLRWRILYLSWLKALDPRNFKLENRLKKLKWYDGYSIFFVGFDGFVYKFTLQKIMPDDSKLYDKTNVNKFADKIREVIPNTSANYAESMLLKTTNY